MILPLQSGSIRALADTHGGELVSLRAGDGVEHIWQGSAESWTGRNPILFPIVGRLKDGKVRFEGEEYEMPQHGLARRREFAVIEQGTDYVVLEQRESEETLQRYPYPYCLRVRHELIGNGFVTRFEVSNPGERPMPFCIGAHTGFCCPMQDGEIFEDYVLRFDEAESVTSIRVTPAGVLSKVDRLPVLDGACDYPLAHRVFDGCDTLIFDSLRSHGVSLLNPETGHGVHMDFTGFPLFAVWTMPQANAPYLCLEPWVGCAAMEDDTGDFLDKPFCVTLAPGESWTIHYTVTLI